MAWSVSRVIVPIYESLTKKDSHAIVTHSDSRVVVGHSDWISLMKLNHLDMIVMNDSFSQLRLSRASVVSSLSVLGSDVLSTQHNSFPDAHNLAMIS
jgi:long-subunit acyl-CoA synthetase (AMP-forming)